MKMIIYKNMEETLIKEKLIVYLEEYIRKNRIEVEGINLRYVSDNLDLGYTFGLDSLDCTEIIMELENLFDVRMNDTDASLIAKHFTFSNLINNFSKLLK